MENLEWLPWFWAALTLLLLIVEVFISGFVLMFFALGSVAASIVGFLGYGIVWQLAAFIVVTLASLLLIRPLTARMTRAGGANTVGIDRVIGKPAVVLIAIDPQAARGRVRIDREEWQATTADGSSIEVGAQAVVLSVIGTRVVVRQTAPPPPPPPLPPRAPEAQPPALPADDEDLPAAAVPSRSPLTGSRAAPSPAPTPGPEPAPSPAPLPAGPESRPPA
jgi:membrane protein implicated in regulation of membrane protease activity